MSTLDAVFSAVVDTSWKGCCAIILVLAVRRCLQARAPAQLLFWIWLAVALRLLLPFSVPASWSPFNPVTWRQDSGDAPNVPPPAAPARRGETSGVDALSRSGPAAAGVAGPFATLTPARWAAMIWCAGIVLLLLARLLAGGIFARRVRQTAVAPAPSVMPVEIAALLREHKVDLLITNAVAAPALLGILRPRILFPPGLLEALSPSELRLIVAHELAHAKRRDLLADLLIHVAAVVHWFNPVVWLAARVARQDCEMACDELVVRRTSAGDHASYGATLLRLATISTEAPRLGVGLGVVGSKRHLKRRIEMLTRSRAFALPGTLLSGAVFIALIGFSFTSRSTAQPGATPAAAAQSAPGPDADDSGIVYDSTVDRLDVLFPTGIVATVHDRSISVADVRREVAPLIPHLKRQSHNQEEFNARLAILQNSTIKSLVDRVLLLRQFHDSRPGEQPRQIAAEYVEKALADTVNERFSGDRAKFLEYLRDRNMTVRDYRKELEEQIIYNYMRGQERKMAGSTGPVRSDPAEKPVRLRIIQLSRSAAETDASLVARADVILARLRNGESFASLATEFDQSGRRDRGGDWGWIGPNDLRPQFRDIFMALKKGDVSAPILMNEGCFLLYADDRR